MLASGGGAPVTPATYVGANQDQNTYSGSTSTSIPWPAGTAAGDLGIYVSHLSGVGHMNTQPSTGPAWTPTGWTQIATADFTEGCIPQTYYVRKVFYKVLNSGDISTSFTIPSGLYRYDGYPGNTFENQLFVLRGHTKIQAYSYIQYAGSGGGSSTLSVPVGGSLIAIASDRGASGYPTISPSAGTELYGVATGGAFYNRNLVEVDYTAGTVYTFTDFNDTYPTSALMLVTQP